eukprot:5099296-Pyramimonas_sp.AAC.1
MGCFDWTPGEGEAAMNFIRRRRPYLGICFKPQHVQGLYKRLERRVLIAMLNMDDDLYDPKFAELVNSGGGDGPDNGGDGGSKGIKRNKDGNKKGGKDNKGGSTPDGKGNKGTGGKEDDSGNKKPEKGTKADKDGKEKGGSQSREELLKALNGLKTESEKKGKP